MKPTKLLIVLVAMMILIVAVTADATYESRRQDRETRDTEDHPWGGENDRPGIIPVHRVIILDFYYMPFTLINNILVIIIPANTDNGTTVNNNGLLPDNFTPGNTGTDGNNQKGQ